MRKFYLIGLASVCVASLASCTTTQEQKVGNALTTLQIAAGAYADACAAYSSSSGPCKPSIAKTVGTAGAVAGAAKAVIATQAATNSTP